MENVKAELVDLSDQVWRRTRARLEGLTDDEYRWEPVPGCWSLRPRPDGRLTWESVLPAPDPVPFTTIAWRLWHLIDMYGEDRAPDLLLALLECGAALPTDPPTPLHFAAAAGEVTVVRALLAAGADPALTDPDFHAPPAQWAAFFGHRDLAAELEEAARPG